MFSVIFVGESGSLTDTVYWADTRLLRLEVAVIVTVPPFTPVTTPLDVTVATRELEVDHFTSALVPEGYGTALSWMVDPRATVLLPETDSDVGAGRF